MSNRQAAAAPTEEKACVKFPMEEKTQNQPPKWYFLDSESNHPVLTPLIFQQGRDRAEDHILNCGGHGSPETWMISRNRLS